MDDARGIIPLLDPSAVFTRGGTAVDAVIAEIQQKTKHLVFDMETATGRRYCASVAYLVSRSKTLLDKAGQEVVSDWKTKSRKVDADRRKLREELDNIRDAVRAPLTEWEARQAREKARRVRKIDEIRRIGAVTDQNGNNLTAEECERRLVFLREIPEPDDWYRSMRPEAVAAYRKAQTQLASALELRREEERAAKAESERVAQAARAAEEAAQAEIRRKIEADKARAVAQARAEEQAKAAEEAQRAAKAAIEAEANRRVEEEKAAATKKAAAEAEAEARRKDEAMESRSKAPATPATKLPDGEPGCVAIDLDTRADIVSALVDLGVPIGVVSGVVTAIVAGEVPHVRIE